ncbi:hypothetical protein B0A48_17157 [Cryoendolithus antarcticus]|uniref:HAD-like protein n=1 Tax=Cryoendolithus antarcticus TaxID=1507870 RepID=A0A1V8SCC0_9PEZI|nr:hypothetical protein B0A48_17157 [Cryoendolithus antarcticus]
MTSRRRFAPVGRSKDSDGERLQGVVFDMDGTLCEPQNYMFGEMREALGITKAVDILDHIYSLPADQQAEAHAKIEAIEHAAMRKQVPQPGLVTLMEFLDKHRIPKAICTRNFDIPVDHFLGNHFPGHVKAFHPVVTREFRPPKPSPAGILHIAHSWKVVGSASVPEISPADRPVPLLMVGDSIDDMIAGHDAGAVTVLLRSAGKEELERDGRTHIVIDRLDDLVGILEKGLEI